MTDAAATFQLDGHDVPFAPGQSILAAAQAAGHYIPHLCYHPEFAPHGSCKVCTVKVNGHTHASCTTPAHAGDVVESATDELTQLRLNLVQFLFTEGNHFCPSCEKSGSCELQHLAYRFKVLAPRFPFLFPQRKIEAGLPHLLIEHNRCIQCLRCVRGVKARGGQDIFGFRNRGREIRITVDTTVPDALSDDTAIRAEAICPVGALIRKGPHYLTPIGQRRFDLTPIGADVDRKGGGQ